jgi:hypothetical protein
MFGFRKPKPKPQSNTKEFYVSNNGGEKDGTISFQHFKDGIAFEKAPINHICIYPNEYLMQFSYKINDTYNSIIQYNFSSNPEMFNDAMKAIVTDYKPSPRRQSSMIVKPPSQRPSPSIETTSFENIVSYLKNNTSIIKRIQLNEDTLSITHKDNTIQTFQFVSNDYTKLTKYINSDPIATTQIERVVDGHKQAWGGGKKKKVSKPKATKKK